MRDIFRAQIREGAMEFFDFVFEDAERVVAVEDAILVVTKVRIEGAFFDLAFGDALLDELKEFWSGRHQVRQADDVRDGPE